MMLPDKNQPGRPAADAKTPEPRSRLLRKPDYTLYTAVGESACILRLPGGNESFNRRCEIRYAAYRRGRITPNSDPTVNITRTPKNRQARILWEGAVGKREFTQEVESVFLPLNLLYV